MSQITVTYTRADGGRKVVEIDGAKHDAFDVVERCRQAMFPGVEPSARDERFERALAVQAQARTETVETAEQDHARAKEQAARAATGKAGSTPAQSQRSGETGGWFDSSEVRSGEPKARPATADRGAAESALQGANTGVRDTSRDAYAKHAASGKLGRQHEIIMVVLRGSQRDMTRQELSKKTGLGINAVCGRVNELMEEPFRLIAVHRKRRCDVTGETVEALRAA